MKVAIRLKNGSKAMFEKTETHESAEWGHKEWAELAKQSESEVATVLVQVK